MTAYASSLLGKLDSWVEAFILHLPNLVLAVVIVVVATALARGARAVVRRVLMAAASHASQARNVVDLLATLAFVAVLSAGLFMALGVLNLSGVVTSLLAGAGIVGLALGFAFQDIASNFIAGVLMAVRTPFVIGQVIETQGFEGTVTELTLRETVIITFQGQRVILPNAKVYGDAITNFSTQRERRVDIDVGVGYGDDLAAAERAAIEAVRALPMTLGERPVTAHFSGFGDSSIDLTVRFWIHYDRQPDFLVARSEAVKAVKAGFDAAGVTIPFPIRTLDFGPNGGVALGEAWPQRANGSAAG